MIWQAGPRGQKETVMPFAPGQPRCPPVHWRKMTAVARWEDDRATTTTRTERRVHGLEVAWMPAEWGCPRSVAVGAAEVEEVVIEEGERPYRPED